MEVALKKEIIVNKQVCRAIGVALFVILTGLGAFVRIPLPFTPVPLTLQTLFVLLSGAMLGARLGAFTQALYALLGVMGVPLFAGAGVGAVYLFGPTGGYVFGFVLASFVIGAFLRKRQGNFLSTVSVMLLADALLLLCGALWLKVFTGMSLSQAFWAGVAPFIAGDIIKAFVAAGVFQKSQARIRKIF